MAPHTDFLIDQTSLEHLEATGSHTETDAFLARLHAKYHDRPREHIRVHLLWMRIDARRGAYLGALGQLLAGLLFAGPASLVQRHTGLVVPAFDAERRQ